MYRFNTSQQRGVACGGKAREAAACPALSCMTPSELLTRDSAHRAEDRRAGLGSAGRRADGLNVGAGTGSYEPPDRDVTAVEPSDGFYHAYWRRPEEYLDEHVRRGISIWARVGPDAEQRAVHSLRDDLASGRWVERNRDLVDLDAAELGLRLLLT
jgi:hypothetical protein